MPLLEVRNLRTFFRTTQGTLKAVDGISFTLDKGEALGLAGESGCGKTTAALSIMKLLPENGFIQGGEIYFREPEDVRAYRLEYEKLALDRMDETKAKLEAEVGELEPRVKEKRATPAQAKQYADAQKRLKSMREHPGYYIREALKPEREALEARLKSLATGTLTGGGGAPASPEAQEAQKRLAAVRGDHDILRRSAEAIRQMRWRDMSIIFQGAMNALNPVRRVGDQITEPILLHEDVEEPTAVKRAQQLFELVGISPKRIREYPHEFSGGMRQRVMIAMALACRPRLVIADEPTTALDVMIQAQILQLMRTLQRELDLAMIVISHDLSVLAETCNRLVIMYAGKMVEYADAVKVFKNPLHPYTQGLVGAFPNIHGDKKLPAFIPGTPPNLIHPPSACRFSPRCAYRMEICDQVEPPLIDVGEGHWVACHLVTKG